MNYLNKAKDLRSVIPEGERGNWKIEKFVVSKQDAQLEMMRAVANPQYGMRFVPEGNYTRLTRNGYVVMSDTPDEVNDLLGLISVASGHGLINGLGLGIAVRGVLLKPEVEHVTVIEIDPDIIALVGTYLQDEFGDRLTIIQANALTYKPKPNTKFDFVWHDIWDAICADNLPEMHTLHRKYGGRTNWQYSWCREQCEWAAERWK